MLLLLLFADLKAAFALFDKDGDGSISETEIRDVLKSLSCKMTEKEIRDMLREVDSDGETDPSL